MKGNRVKHKLNCLKEFKIFLLNKENKFSGTINKQNHFFSPRITNYQPLTTIFARFR
jgi:hypothetical protein